MPLIKPRGRNGRRPPGHHTPIKEAVSRSVGVSFMTTVERRAWIDAEVKRRGVKSLGDVLNELIQQAMSAKTAQ